MQKDKDCNKKLPKHHSKQAPGQKQTYKREHGLLHEGCVAVSQTLGHKKRHHRTTVQGWKRKQIESVTPQPIPMRDGFVDPWVVSEDFPEVVVQGRMRRHSTHWIVTLFLVNAQLDPTTRKDEAWLFQPELMVAIPTFAFALKTKSLGGTVIVGMLLFWLAGKFF